MLEVKDLCKTYIVNKKQNHVLKNINLNIKKGEFVTVMGPSGSGKSTLLYNISGMDKSTSGSVNFEGNELCKLNEKKLSEFRLNKMGFIFQQNNLLNNLGIVDNIILPAYMAKNNTKKEINKYAVELMEKTKISDLSENDITQASGGQLQRVAICRALINKPDIIFGDEPTGSLNSSSANNIMEILLDINSEGKTIMLVTHDPKIAAMSEKVFFMIDGKIKGTFTLGKYKKEPNDIKKRESKLSNWLLDMGW
jgi:putative ABC transport system ATP-binding protein